MRSFKNIIKIAEDAGVKQLIYQFRYQIYIEEMGKPYQNADHHNKVLMDVLDENCTLLYAEQDGEIIGTVRINWGWDKRSFMTFDNENFNLTPFKTFPNETFSFTSRLMVHADLRKSMLASDLAQRSYQEARGSGISFNFISCHPTLTKVFERMGYRYYNNEFIDHEAGKQIPYVLVLEDINHLQRVKSPFYKEALRWNNNQIYADWFDNSFENQPKHQIKQNTMQTQTISYKTELKNIVQTAISDFQHNSVCKKADDGSLLMSDYHKILRMIFHQTYEGPQTFALAGVNCSSKFQIAKDYLFHHADEEKTHWQWILNDLAHTNYQGEDVKSSFPLSACQNYIAFNYYNALKMPTARLAIAAVLEGIGAEFGAKYARRICELLKLKPEQAQFYFGHGDTDKEHIVDIWRVIDDCDLTEEEWRWMGYAAKTAGNLYKQMYDEALNY